MCVFVVLKFNLVLKSMRLC